VLVEDSNGSALSGHVGALSHQLHSRLHQCFSVVLANLVLGSTGQSNVVLGVCAPWLLALNILACQQQLESVISIISITSVPNELSQQSDLSSIASGGNRTVLNEQMLHAMLQPEAMVTSAMQECLSHG